MKIIKTLINKYLLSGEIRSVKVKKNIIGLFFLKGISVLVGFILFPLTISYVSSFQYGIWLTISSIIGWLSFFDIGFGNGLKNKLVEALAKNDIELAKTYISTTYTVLFLIFTGVAIFSFPLALNLNWVRILNAPIEMANELTIVVLIVVFNFCFQFVLRLLNSILLAIQSPFLASLCDTCIQLLSFFLILFLIHFTKGSLINLALVTGISQIVVLLLFSFICFRTILKHLMPGLKYVKFKSANNIMNMGIKFFLLQIIAIICYQINNIVISQKIGPEEVTIYNIAFRYASVINMIFVIIIAPFWSAFTDAYVLEDYEWMKRITAKLKKMMLGLFILSIIMIIISPVFYKIWVGREFKISIWLTCSLFFWQIANIWGSLFSTILYGIGKIRVQLIGSIVGGIVYIPLVLFCCERWGIMGLVLGPAFFSFLTMNWIGPVQVQKILNKKANGIWNK